MHPEIEFVIVDGPAPGSWKGVASASAAWRDFLDAWQEWHVEVNDYRELDDERILVGMLGAGHGTASGLRVRQMRVKMASVFHVQDGKVARLVNYFDYGRALADLALHQKSSSTS